MQKLQFIAVAVLLFFGCGEDTAETSDTIQKEDSYTSGKVPKKNAVNEEARLVLAEWEAFSDFSKSADILYQASNKEDLILAIEDIMVKEKLLTKSKYPRQFDTPQIKSRQQVLRTFILKVKGDLDGNRNPTASMVQMMNAYNALRNQFNIIMGNQLELNLFLEGESN